MCNTTMICKNPAVKTEAAGRLRSGSLIVTIQKSNHCNL